MTVFLGGLIVGAGADYVVDSQVASANPTIHIGSNMGRIISFNVQSFPTPNFLFQQEGRLPVVLYPKPEVLEQIPVTLTDGQEISFSELMTGIQQNEERFNSSQFEINYQEKSSNELGWVEGITQKK